jgi:probable HAF family extracellular repeat protein
MARFFSTHALSGQCHGYLVVATVPARLPERKFAVKCSERLADLGWGHRGKAMTAAMTAALVVSVGAAAAAADGSPTGPSTGMRLVDLGTLGSGDFSQASMMNDLGDVVGIGNAVPGSWNMHVVLWRDGRAIDVAGGFGYLGTAASGVNNRGQVIGCLTRDGGRQAFVWQDGQLTMLGPGCASGINELGQVVGSRPTPAGQSRAFLWEQGTMTDLPTPDGSNSGANAINEKGQIIGYLSSCSAAGGGDSAMWEDGKVTCLGTVGGASNFVIGINNRGQIIGGSLAGSTPFQLRPFLWERGIMSDLIPDDGFGDAYDLNDVGEVVGRFDDRPFLWRNGRLVDLDIPRRGWAIAINKRSQVVGTEAAYPDPSRPFLWQGGRVTYLETLGAGGGACDIDSRGRVAGSIATTSTTPTGGSHAAVWIPAP